MNCWQQGDDRGHNDITDKLIYSRTNEHTADEGQKRDHDLKQTNNVIN